jgi:hypothetical protein
MLAFHQWLFDFCTTNWQLHDSKQDLTIVDNGDSCPVQWSSLLHWPKLFPFLLPTPSSSPYLLYTDWSPLGLRLHSIFFGMLLRNACFLHLTNKVIVSSTLFFLRGWSSFLRPQRDPSELGHGNLPPFLLGAALEQMWWCSVFPVSLTLLFIFQTFIRLLRPGSVHDVLNKTWQIL